MKQWITGCEAWMRRCECFKAPEFLIWVSGRVVKPKKHLEARPDIGRKPGFDNNETN